jgi:hypothetical protein
MFAVAKPGENATENQIFFEDLAEQIVKPALADFDRYLTWKTEIKPADDGKWRVTFETLRNSGESMPPAVSNFSGPYTIQSDSEEAANAFARTLSQEILRQQQFFSRERPVEQFGEPSMNVIIRESLRKALKQPRVDCMGNNLLTTIQREPARIK